MSETHFYDPYAQFDHFKMPNGLNAHLSEWKDRDWIEVEIVVHAGARNDLPVNSGLMHYVEHLVSSNVPGKSPKEMHTLLRSVGGKVRLGATGYSSTCYGFKIPADPRKLEDTLNVFGQMLFEAKLTQGIEKQRKIIIQEFLQDWPSPRRIEVELAMRKNLFGEIPFAGHVDPLGFPGLLEKIKQRNLQEAYDRYYVPANTSIVIMGGLPKHMLLGALESSAFNQEKPGDCNPLAKAQLIFPSPKNRRLEVTSSWLHGHRRQQAQYTAKWAYPVNIPAQTMEIFNEMLQELLNHTMREKRKMTYSVENDNTRYEHLGEYVIASAINPKLLPSMEHIVHGALNKIRRGKAIRMFDEIRQQLAMSNTMSDPRGHDVCQAVAEDLSEYRRLITLRKDYDELLNTTYEDVAQIAKLFSPDRQFTTVVTPD